MTESQPSFKRELLASLPSLRAFAISLIGRHDRADDLVQDTIMKAWAKQDHYQMGTNMKAWLFTILRNELFSQMRKHGREIQDSDGAFTDSMATHPSQYGSMDLQDFRRALEKLPPDQREAVVLVGDPPYYGPLGFEKVAWNALAFPGPVDPARVLVMPFAEDTHARLKGVIAWRCDEVANPGV